MLVQKYIHIKYTPDASGFFYHVLEMMSWKAELLKTQGLWIMYSYCTFCISFFLFDPCSMSFEWGHFIRSNPNVINHSKVSSCISISPTFCPLTFPFSHSPPISVLFLDDLFPFSLFIPFNYLFLWSLHTWSLFLMPFLSPFYYDFPQLSLCPFVAPSNPSFILFNEAFSSLASYLFLFI